MPFRRDQQRDRLADRLGCRISEQALGTRIPAKDPALQGFADDGVVGGCDERVSSASLLVGARTSSRCSSPFSLASVTRLPLPWADRSSDRKSAATDSVGESARRQLGRVYLLDPDPLRVQMLLQVDSQTSAAGQQRTDAFVEGKQRGILSAFGDRDCKLCGQRYSRPGVKPPRRMSSRPSTPVRARTGGTAWDGCESAATESTFLGRWRQRALVPMSATGTPIFSTNLPCRGSSDLQQTILVN